MTETPAAGWYPEPTGIAGTDRWWDGEKWTDQTRGNSFDDRLARQRGEVAQVQRQPTVTYVPAKTNHILHLILSIVTLGAWLPIWLTVAIVNQGKFVARWTY